MIARRTPLFAPFVFIIICDEPGRASNINEDDSIDSDSANDNFPFEIKKQILSFIGERKRNSIDGFRRKKGENVTAPWCVSNACKSDLKSREIRERKIVHASNKRKVLH